MKEMAQKKVIVIRGHREVSITESKGESSENRGRSIKPHKDLRSQRPGGCRSTGALEGQFQFHIQTATRRKQVPQRSGHRIWVTGVEQASVKSKNQNKEVQTVQNL